MALSLDDIKKKREQRKKPQPVAPTQIKVEKTKPWQKPQLEEDDIQAEAAELVEKVTSWGKRVKIYPKLEIPIPDFLLTKEPEDS